MPNELVVGPFPISITKKEKEHFLVDFGAVKVVHIFQKHKEVYRYATALFNSHKDCEYALHKIHQLKILGVRLSAKYHTASKQHTGALSHTEIHDIRTTEAKEDPCDASLKLKAALLNYEAQLSSINACFGVNHPISPKLRYTYPPLTPSVLCNIAHTLASVPKFYTQVLHLMNKMNLPCPFGPLTGEPPLCREAKTLTTVFDAARGSGDTEEGKENVADETQTNLIHAPDSYSESELESDEELKSILTKKKSEPKRILKRRQNKINKKPRLETLKQALLNPKENVNRAPKDDSSFLKEVFEVANLTHKKKLNVKVQNAAPLPTDDDDDAAAAAASKAELVSEGFGKMYPQAREDKAEEEEPKQSTQFISAEEITANRIPEAEWPIIPVFKNYTPGRPSPRLYIKNLAKTTTAHDLRFIFGRNLAPDTDEEATKCNVRLMKEGRMKGQAFVTFPSMEAASAALQASNGFILKDKPMVIVFGKVKAAD